MEEFIEWRHKIDVPAESIEVLNQLKDRYPLSVITNGNVIAKRIGFEHFQLSFTWWRARQSETSSRFVPPNRPLFWRKTE